MDSYDTNLEPTDPNLYENFLWMMPTLQHDDCDYPKAEHFTETECSESAMYFFEPTFVPDEVAMAGFWPMFYPQEQSEQKPQQERYAKLPRPMIHTNSSLRIGTLTYEERQIKVQKYLDKRKRRSFSKKISYNCRKRVADSRLRVKGRFITKSQASALKGLENAKNSVN